MRWLRESTFLILGIILLSITGCSSLAATQPTEFQKTEFQIDLKEYSIGSGEIQLPESDKPVKITIKNKGMSSHNLVIEELGVESGIIRSGESITLDLQTKDAGIYDVKCTLPGHTEAGMVSKVIVGE